MPRKSLLPVDDYLFSNGGRKERRALLSRRELRLFFRGATEFRGLTRLRKYAFPRHGACARIDASRAVSLAKLDKGQGPVIRWRDDFLIIAPPSEPRGLVAGVRDPLPLRIQGNF